MTITANSAATKVVFGIRQQGNEATQFATANSYITGIYAGFNVGVLGYIKDVESTIDTKIVANQVSQNQVVLNTVNAALSSALFTDTVYKNDFYTDSRGNMLPILPTPVINCWGDSLTAASYPLKLATLLSRTVNNCGIGGETSNEILNRINAYSPNISGITWITGTIRLKARRVVPYRLTTELYRGDWTTFGKTIADTKKIEFFNANGLIGSTRNQLKAVATVSGAVLTSAGHPFVNGDQVYHPDTPVTGMYAYKVYYVRDATANTYALSEYAGTAAISFGSGTVTSLGDYYYDWAYTTGVDHTISTITTTKQDTETAVLWMGANNIGNVEAVKADISAAYRHFKSFAKRIIVMTVLPGNINTKGTSAGIALANVNAWILQEFEGSCIDALGYLQSKANLALTQDVTDVANGITPSSLRVDAIHLTEPGYQHIADAVASFITAKKW